MKKERQRLILKIISENPIGLQEEIQKKLMEHGLKVTQATISRDIKELALVKAMDRNGQYRYYLPAHLRDNNGSAEELFINILRQSMVSVDNAMNTVVIKTHIGMAQAVCAKLDRANYIGLVGTLAGDDTIFALMRSEQDAVNFKRIIEEIAKQVK